MSEIVVTVKLPKGVEADDVEVTVNPMPAKAEESSAWAPIETAPRDGRYFTAWQPIWKRFAVVSWDAGERHGEAGYSEHDRNSGWLIRDGATSSWLWSGQCLPAPAEARSEQAEGEA